MRMDSIWARDAPASTSSSRAAVLERARRERERAREEGARARERGKDLLSATPDRAKERH